METCEERYDALFVEKGQVGADGERGTPPGNDQNLQLSA